MKLTTILERRTPTVDTDLAECKKLHGKLRYKFYRCDSEVGCAKLDQATGLWLITGGEISGHLTGPQLRQGIKEWIKDGGSVMPWACALPECNTAEMQALCATLPNVTHGYCERCGPKYLLDLQAEVLMLNSCRSPAELRRS